MTNVFLFSLFLAGQGALTLHCLQRRPDQTITLSGSRPAQTAPKGSGSTDKWARGHPAMRGRDTKRRSEEHPTACLLAKAAVHFLHFFPSVQWYCTSRHHGHTAPSSSHQLYRWDWEVIEQLLEEVKRKMCSLLSPLQSV